MEVRFLTEAEYNDWNEFVDMSPQGAITAKTIWLTLTCENFKIVGCFEESQLIAGLAFEEKRIGFFRVMLNPIMTQFVGFLFRHGPQSDGDELKLSEKKILDSLIDFLELRYHRIAINLHYNLQDIRPFIWRDYNVIVRYSYLANLTDLTSLARKRRSGLKDNFRKAKKAGLQVVSDDDVACFHYLHELTFSRQNLKCPITFTQVMSLYKGLKPLDKCILYFAKTPQGEAISSVFIVLDNETAYYLLGANHPNYRCYGAGTMVLWEAIQDLALKQGITRFDFYGANTETIARHKGGFGGELISYYRVVKFNSTLLKLADKLRRIRSGEREER